MNLLLAGKHRGIVVDNVDPLKLGRLKVRVPAAYGQQPVDDLPWAWPCFPFGGTSNCGFFSLPKLGAGVWVEFQWQNGEPNPTYPVWCGTWIPEGGTPTEVAGGPEDAHYYTVLKTADEGHVIVLCDKPGLEYMRVKHGKTGALIEFDAAGNIVLHPASGKQILGLSSWTEEA